MGVVGGMVGQAGWGGCKRDGGVGSMGGTSRIRDSDAGVGNIRRSDRGQGERAGGIHRRDMGN